MTDNAKKVLNYLKEAGAGVKFTTNQVAKDLGFEKSVTVTGSVSNLVKKGYAEKFVESEEDEDGKVKNVKYYALTEAGMNYDPDNE